MVSKMQSIRAGSRSVAASWDWWIIAALEIDRSIRKANINEANEVINGLEASTNHFQKAA